MLHQPNLADDHRFSSGVLRVRNRAELERIISNAFENVASDQLTQTLSDADIAFGRVNSVEGLSKHVCLDEVTIQNECQSEVRLPREGARVDNNVLDGDSAIITRKVPELGEHNTKIRTEFS